MNKTALLPCPECGKVRQTYIGKGGIPIAQRCRSCRMKEASRVYGNGRGMPHVMTEGDGYVNLCFTMLAYSYKYRDRMWYEFANAFDIKTIHPNVMQMALWISHYCLERKKEIENDNVSL